MHCFKFERIASRRVVATAVALVSVLSLGWPGRVVAAAHALSLDEALTIAVRDSSLLAAQRAAIGAAEQYTVSARELPDPKLKLVIENLPTESADKFSLTRDFMTMRRIGIAQEFPRTEKRELKGRRAEHQLAREQAMLGDARSALRREVASAWTERYYAEEMARAVSEQYAETVLQRDVLQAGVSGGRTPTPERLAVEVALQALLDRRAEFTRQATRAQALLARWLGDAARRPLASPPESAPTAVVADHAPHHPHVQSLDRQIDIAQSEADLAKAATKPDWGLELSYAQRGPAYTNMLTVQVSIDLPLFADKRQNREALARAAQVEQARALREDALRQHLAEVAAARIEWEAATARMKRFDDSLLPLSRERAALALAAYRGGNGTLATVLEARRMELDLRLQKLQLAAEQGRARAQLIYFLPEEVAK